MTIDKFDPVFAESGTVDSDAKYSEYAANGLVDEVLRYKSYNKVIQMSQRATNSIITRGAGAGCPDKSHYLEIFSGDTSVCNLYDPSNIFDTTGASLGALYGKSIGLYNGRPSIFRMAPFNLEIFDIENKNFVKAINCSTIIGYATLAGCVYNGVAYVVSNTSPFSISAIDIETESVLWGPVNLSSGSDNTYLKVFMATETQVAVLQSWVTISSGVDAGVVVLDAATGTIDGSGAGDCGSPSSGQVIGACSNGSYVFLAVYNGSSIILSSMSLSSFGSTGCGWSFPPRANPTGIAKANFGGIACAGNTIIMTFSDGTNLYLKYTVTQGLVSIMQTGDPDLVKRLYAVVSDGLDFWAVGTRENKGGTNLILMLYKLRGARFSGYNSNPGVGAVYETYTDGEKYVDGFKANDSYQSSFSPGTVGLLADGDSIFVLGGGQYTISQLKRALTR